MVSPDPPTAWVQELMLEEGPFAAASFPRHISAGTDQLLQHPADQPIISRGSEELKGHKVCAEATWFYLPATTQVVKATSLRESRSSNTSQVPAALRQDPVQDQQLGRAFAPHTSGHPTSAELSPALTLMLLLLLPNCTCQKGLS